MSWKDIVLGHEKRIQDMAKALHCLKLEVRDLEKLTKPKPTEAVRCKDCKYWELQSIIPPIPYGYCHYLNDDGEGWDTRKWNADDFCSRGERK